MAYAGRHAYGRLSRRIFYRGIIDTQFLFSSLEIVVEIVNASNPVSILYIFQSMLATNISMNRVSACICTLCIFFACPRGHRAQKFN